MDEEPGPLPPPSNPMTTPVVDVSSAPALPSQPSPQFIITSAPHQPPYVSTHQTVAMGHGGTVQTSAPPSQPPPPPGGYAQHPSPRGPPPPHSPYHQPPPQQPQHPPPQSPSYQPSAGPPPASFHPMVMSQRAPMMPYIHQPQGPPPQHPPPPSSAAQGPAQPAQPPKKKKKKPQQKPPTRLDSNIPEAEPRKLRSHSAKPRYITIKVGPDGAPLKPAYAKKKKVEGGPAQAQPQAFPQRQPQFPHHHLRSPLPPGHHVVLTQRPGGVSGAGGSRKLSPAAARQRAEEEAYARKHYLLKRSIKALVFKNAALCDEVARLKQRMATVAEERKILLRRVFHHKRLEQRRKQMAEKRLAHHQALASMAAAEAASSGPSGVPSAELQSPGSVASSCEPQAAEEKTLAAIAREAQAEKDSEPPEPLLE